MRDCIKGAIAASGRLRATALEVCSKQGEAGGYQKQGSSSGLIECVSVRSQHPECLEYSGRSKALSTQLLSSPPPLLYLSLMAD